MSSNEEGKKGRIQVGQLADLIVPDRDYFTCASEEIAEIRSELTVVGGRIVYAAGDFASFDEAPPPAMPDWSPARSFGRDGSWGSAKPLQHHVLSRNTCACSRSCAVHGHDHAAAWSCNLPVSDLKIFWGLLGCACWAV
jgi:Amidohydrolase family